MQTQRMLRKPALMDRTGLANSTVHWHVTHGLLPKPVKIGARAAAWPEQEIAAIMALRTTGADNDAVKALVVELIAKRQEPRVSSAE